VRFEEDVGEGQWRGEGLDEMGFEEEDRREQVQFIYSNIAGWSK